jgi:hypothetical protein
MTDQTLKRGQEINAEISVLKHSVAEMLQNRLFGRVGQATMYGQSADPFLAELEVKTRMFVVDSINKRIKQLSNEFKAL